MKFDIRYLKLGVYYIFPFLQYNMQILYKNRGKQFTVTKKKNRVKKEQKLNRNEFPLGEGGMGGLTNYYVKIIF